jgi:hypothetical protein
VKQRFRIDAVICRKDGGEVIRRAVREVAEVEVREDGGVSERKALESFRSRIVEGEWVRGLKIQAVKPDEEDS